MNTGRISSRDIFFRPFRYLLIGLVVVFITAHRIQANPTTMDPGSMITFGILVFWAFVVEAGIVTLLLLAFGVQPLPMFGAYFLANAIVFFFVFQPLLDREWSVPALESLIVGVDGIAIKFLQSRQSLQGNTYRGVSWRNALLISLMGNCASFFVGLLADRKPWMEHFIDS